MYLFEISTKPHEQAPGSVSVRAAALLAWVAGLLVLLLALSAGPLRAQTYNDAVVGYAWVVLTSTTPPADFSYNRAGGTIGLQISGVGQYVVRFSDAALSMQGGGHIQVTPYSSGDVHCFVEQWGGTRHLLVGVGCKDSEGNRVHSNFDILVLDSNPGSNANLAFARINNANPTGGEADLSSLETTHNPGGGPTILTHGAVGRYVVRFESLQSAPFNHIVNIQVTAYGNNFASCSAPNSFQWSSGHLYVHIHCRGHDGAYKNARFNVLVTSRNEVAAGYAYAGKGASVSDSDWTEMTGAYNPFGTVEGRRTDIGLYQVRFNGLNTEGSGGNFIVTLTGAFANGTTITTMCNLVSWAPEADAQTVTVQCLDDEGNPKEGHFMVLSTFVDAMPVADEATPAQLADVLTAPSPNPVRGTASFAVAVEHGQNVIVEVFDALGRRVRTLYDAPLAAGMSETLSLDASALPAGVYVIRATGEGFTKSRRFTVVR